MKSSTVIFSYVLAIAIAILPYISNAAPLLSSEGNALPNTQHLNSPSTEGGQFQFAQYGPYQQQQQQQLRFQKKWSRLEPSIRFFKRSEQQQQQQQSQTNNNYFNSEFENRFMPF